MIIIRNKQIVLPKTQSVNSAILINLLLMKIDEINFLYNHLRVSIISFYRHSGVTSIANHSGPLLQKKIGVSRTFYCWGLRSEALYRQLAPSRDRDEAGRAWAGMPQPTKGPGGAS